MFVLFDSRSRALNGRRTAYEFPETQAGLRAAWVLVISAELPEEFDDYIGLSVWMGDDEDGVFSPCEVLNAYWSVFGWCMERFEEDGFYAADVDVIPGVTNE